MAIASIAFVLFGSCLNRSWLERVFAAFSSSLWVHVWTIRHNFSWMDYLVRCRTFWYSWLWQVGNSACVVICFAEHLHVAWLSIVSLGTQHLSGTPPSDFFFQDTCLELDRKMSIEGRETNTGNSMISSEFCSAQIHNHVSLPLSFA